MEKLIELLNEHFKEKYKNSKRNLIYFERYDDINHGFNMNNEDRVYNGFVAEETIFGKRYRFIKWLVENDKIDLDKVKEIGIKHNGRMDVDGLYRFSVYERILMLLSISSSPIDDLISYLK